MKTLLAILLLLPSVGFCQWRAVKISSDTDTQAIQENFRRASIYSNRKLDKYTPDTMYRKLTLKDDLVLEDGGVLTSTAPFAQLAATQTFTGADTFTGSVRISSLTIPSTTGLMISTFSATGNGFTYLPGGLLMQWGTFQVAGVHGTTYSMSYPKAFPNSVFVAVASLASTVATTTTVTYCPLNGGDNNGFTCQFGALNGGTYTTTIEWVAIGY